MKEKLSIIIPVYNAEKYIKKCIESIVKNVKYLNLIEIIIINDGSEDNSLFAIEEIKKNYKNIKYINKDNTGVSDTRNIGIDFAKGKYLMFVDADDELNENWFEILEKYLKKDLDIVFFQRNSFEMNEEKILKNILKYEGNCWSFANPWSKIFKTSFIKKNKIKFKNEIINGEDMLFNLEALSNTNNYCIVNKSIYKYRISENQSTKKFRNEIIDSDIKFHKELKEILNYFSLDEKLKFRLINNSKIGGVYLIIKRISEYGNFSMLKEKSIFLNNKLHYDILLDDKNRKSKIIKLYYKKRYVLVYLYFKAIKLLNFLKNKKEFFVEV